MKPQVRYFWSKATSYKTSLPAYILDVSNWCFTSLSALVPNISKKHTSLSPHVILIVYKCEFLHPHHFFSTDFFVYISCLLISGCSNLFTNSYLMVQTSSYHLIHIYFTFSVFTTQTHKSVYYTLTVLLL